MADNYMQQRQHNEAEWQRMLRRTRDWILSHNDDVRGPTAKENPALAIWIREQRRNFADFVTIQQNHNEFFPTFLSTNGTTFTQRHIDLLNSIGFDWRETEFDIMFRQFENFKLTHGGSCRIPLDYADAELVRWVQVQRDNKTRLDSIGFEWDEENINPNNLCSQCFQKKNSQQPFQQQINQQPTKLIQQQQQLQQQQKSPPTEQIHATAARWKRKADEIQEYGKDDQDESDNDDYGEDNVDNTAGGNDSGYRSSERGAKFRWRVKKYNIDTEQFNHLPTNDAKRNAIISAVNAERRRRKELKRKKIVLFDTDDSNQDFNVDDDKKKGDSNTDEKAEDLSDDSSLSEVEKPPDYDLKELLSDDDEEEEPEQPEIQPVEPVEFTEEEILAFPVSCVKDWDAMFAKLVSFRKEHGHVSVPSSYSDKKLYRWCDSQRSRIKNNRITKAEMHRLESVGFQVKGPRLTYTSTWNQMFRQLGELQQKAGVKITTKLLHSEKSPEAERLMEWMTRQSKHRKHGMLSEKRIKKLDAIGFDWGLMSREDKWEYMFTKMCEFKKEHGHCRVPQRYILIEHGKKKRVGKWVSDLRKNRKVGKVSDERIKRLDAVGFEWVVDRRAPQIGLES